MSLDLGPALRASFLDQQDPALQALATAIVEQLGEYQGEPSVFAFRPVPEEAADPIILINPDAAIGDGDGLNSPRPIVQRDIIIYGRKGPPGDESDQSPIVEALGYQVRELFHRQKFAVQPAGYSVIEVIATGPVPAPVDDDGEVGRVVSLTIRLRRNA
jgi:hypothetical protein